MIVLHVAANALRRLARDRTALFFLLVMPAVIILIVGMVVGVDDVLRVGVADQGGGAEARALRTDLAASPSMKVTSFDDDVDAARTALRRGELDAVVVLPAGLRQVDTAAEPVEVSVVGEATNGANRAAREAVGAIVAEHAAEIQAARAFAARSGVGVDEARRRTAGLAASMPAVEIRTTVVDSDTGFLPAGFSYSAPTMLVLFVFITSLAGGGAMIENRRLGIHSRMLAAPLTSRTIVAGEALSYVAVAGVQSAIIVGLGAFVFGVDWGDPFAAAALISLWALVGAGAGMLAGTLFRTPEQATSIGTTVGMAAGMLGGCMWPLEIVGPTMRAVGHAMPHAWAIDAWVEILSHGRGLSSIVTPLAVLAGFATVLLVVASRRLQHRLSL